MSETTMMEAATPNNGVPASSSPEQAAATAEALYGNGQKAPESKAPPAAEPAKVESPVGDKTEAEAAKPAGAPDKYAFKAPEGREFDSEVITNFSEVAKELNLTNEAAQKILDKMGPTLASRQESQVKAIRQEWVATAKADAEFGGEKLVSNLATAKKALDTFGTAELRTLLNQSGLGDHPEVIRFMYRAGKAISEDSFVGGAPANGKSKGPMTFDDAANALYSSQS
jgi:hypothetical protein